VVSSARWAVERLGARQVSLIPARGGNGALERLAREGAFEPPDLALFEQAFDAALEVVAGRGAVIAADLWDLERLAACRACAGARRERLTRIDTTGHGEPPVACGVCGAGTDHV